MDKRNPHGRPEDAHHNRSNPLQRAMLRLGRRERSPER